MPSCAIVLGAASDPLTELVVLHCLRWFKHILGVRIPRLLFSLPFTPFGRDSKNRRGSQAMSCHRVMLKLASFFPSVDASYYLGLDPKRLKLEALTDMGPNQCPSRERCSIYLWNSRLLKTTENRMKFHCVHGENTKTKLVSLLFIVFSVRLGVNRVCISVCLATWLMLPVSPTCIDPRGSYSRKNQLSTNPFTPNHKNTRHKRFGLALTSLSAEPLSNNHITEYANLSAEFCWSVPISI